MRRISSILLAVFTLVFLDSCEKVSYDGSVSESITAERYHGYIVQSGCRLENEIYLSYPTDKQYPGFGVLTQTSSGQLLSFNIASGKRLEIECRVLSGFQALTNRIATLSGKSTDAVVLRYIDGNQEWVCNSGTMYLLLNENGKQVLNWCGLRLTSTTGNSARVYSSGNSPLP